MNAVETKAVSIALACRTFQISETWVLERLPDHKINRIGELMPWAWMESAQ